MPLYDVRCAEHGVNEVFRRINNPEPFRCGVEGCSASVEVVFSPHSIPGMSIDSAAEDSRDPRRVSDGTAGFNMGLPPVETVIGMRKDGKPKLATRPVTNNELGSSRAVREYAKRNGLIPVSNGVKRAVGGR